MTENADHRKCHARQVAKCIANENLRRISETRKEKKKRKNKWKLTKFGIFREGKMKRK